MTRRARQESTRVRYAPTGYELFCLGCSATVLVETPVLADELLTVTRKFIREHETHEPETASGLERAT